MWDDGIVRALDDVCRKLKTGGTRLGEAQAGKCLELLERLKKNAASFADQKQNTEKIDHEIIRMIGYLERAAVRGSEKTADQILVSIAESVMYTRQPVYWENEEQKKEELRRKEESLSRLALLVQFQDYYDCLEQRIENLEKCEEGNLEEIRAAAEHLNEIWDERLYYEQKISRVRSGKEKITPDTRDYVNRVNRLADARNHHNRSLMLKQVLKQRSQILLNSIHSINMTAFGTVEILGEESVETLMGMMDLFEKNMSAQKQQNKQLEEITKHFDQIIAEAADTAEADSADADVLMEDLRTLQKIRERHEKEKKVLVEEN